MKFLSVASQLAYSKKIIGLHNLIDYVKTSLEDNDWQDSIRKEFIYQEKEQSSYNPFVLIAIRFFDERASHLKSFNRFKNKEERLLIDLVFFVEEYENFNDDELVFTFCENLYPILEESLLKYKKRFIHFDVQKFLPYLRNRIEDIKNRKFPFEDSSRTLRWALEITKRFEEKNK